MRILGLFASILFCFSFAYSALATTKRYVGMGVLTGSTNEAPLAGLVRVRSIYQNEVHSSVSDLTEEGTGNLVRISGRSEISYVITAAHLVGGRDVRILSGNDELPILGSLVDNDLDIAILEIASSKLPPALDYDLRSRRFTISEELQASEREDSKDDQSVLVGYNALNWSNQHSGSKSSLFDLKLPPWMAGEVESFNYIRFNTEDPAHSAVGLTYDKTRFKFRLKVPGGVSGSIVNEAWWHGPLTGLVTESNYYFGETLLVSAPMISGVFEKYRIGIHGSLSSTRWQMRNGMTYRVFSDGWSEANFIEGRTGSGFAGNTGGAGVGGDTGKGVGGDTGSSAEDFSPWMNKSPRQIFDHYGLEPGMKLNDRSVIGILAMAKVSSSPRPRNLFLYADQDSLEFMRKNSQLYDFTIVDKGADLISTLYTTLGRSLGETFKLRGLSGPPKSMLNPFASNKKFASERQSFIVTASEVRVHLETFSKLFDKTDGKPDDSLDIVLDKYGIPVGSSQKTFLPVIEIRGNKTGELYYVDIRKVFFNDLSLVLLPYLKEDPRGGANEINRQLNMSALIVRNAKSALEIEFTFGPEKSRR